MTKMKPRIRNEEMKDNPKLVSPTDSDNELRVIFQGIYCNFVGRSIKYEVENNLIKPSPVAAVADVQVGEESNKPAVNAEIKPVPDSQLATSQTVAKHQTKGKRPIRSVSDVFIDLSQRVEELPDKIIEYNRAETLTSEDMIGTNFELDENMSDCRSVYCK
ncbi:hypothetical protein EB796_008306 [Bugula neritina]|uniref:Uncharacterized protein n=1 Tax=Bugula neritina TaxID=10212 RepID=A0A7J7K5Z4_BUGNE|nr:hypothetical protein EB796_008306 [Bugula neritina]